MYCFHLNGVIYSRSSLNRLIFVVSDQTDYRNLISFEHEYSSHATSSVGIRNRVEVDLTLSREVDYDFDTRTHYDIVVEPKKHCKFSNRIVYTIRQIGISDIQPEFHGNDSDECDDIIDGEDIGTLHLELFQKIQHTIDSFGQRAKLLKKILKTCGAKNMDNVSLLHDTLEKTTQFEF